MTRLEVHARRFVLDDCRGPLLCLHELTGDELALLNDSFFETVRERAPESIEEMYGVYISVLHRWGVMCPHPIDKRRYDLTNRWYDCSLCKASVIG